MFSMWNVGDVGCWGCGMFEMWDVRDVGCLPGCGVFAGMWDVNLQNAEIFNQLTQGLKLYTHLIEITFRLLILQKRNN